MALKVQAGAVKLLDLKNVYEILLSFLDLEWFLCLSESDGGLVWFKIFVHLTVLKLVKDVGHYARLDPLLKPSFILPQNLSDNTAELWISWQIDRIITCKNQL